MSHTLLRPALIRSIREQYQLPWRGIHGAAHWARVLENGLRLAATTGARQSVVSLFAVFHDARRVNEGWDPQHGSRGAELARSLRDTMFKISDADFELLHVACVHHTEGRSHPDVTVQTCWDADRLDLGRVGIKPSIRYLSTDAAKNPETIAWAYERSIKRRLPDIVTTQWDLA